MRLLYKSSGRVQNFFEVQMYRTFMSSTIIIFHDNLEKAFLKAGVEAGYRFTDDINGFQLG